MEALRSYNLSVSMSELSTISSSSSSDHTGAGATSATNGHCRYQQKAGGAGSGLPRQTSVHNNGRLQRQRSCLRMDDDSRLKPSHSVSDTYELSQDLQDKQLEMLERKYGGQLRTRRAAITIQQAFRKYSMNKKFEKLRTARSEKRNSRRFSEYGRSNSVWNDLHQELAAIDKDGSDPDGMAPHKASMTRAMTLDANYNPYSHGYSDQRDMRLRRSDHIDLWTGEENGNDDNDRTLTRSHESDRERTLTRGEQNKNSLQRSRQHAANCADSSDNNCDASTFFNVDMHSVNFENLLESKESELLNDSFQSDESQESAYPSTPVAVVSPQPQGRRRGPPPPPPPRTTSRLTSMSSEEKRCYSECRDSQTYENMQDVQIRVDYASPTDDDESMRIYNKQEVKMRNRKSHSDVQNNSALTARSVMSPEASPIWKRKSTVPCSGSNYSMKSEVTNRMSNISEGSEPDSLGEARYSTSSQSGSDSASLSSNSFTPASEYGGFCRPIDNVGYQRSARMSMDTPPHVAAMPPRISEKQRKREYRVGLNLFNKKPEKGLRYLVQKCFLKDTPHDVAKFLISRKGLSKQMIGEFLGNLQNPFNMQVLEYFVESIDLHSLEVDVALRKFQTYFRMPGEAQKIERLMEAFAHRYYECNPDVASKFRSYDTVFLLAFAIIMLNTDLHNNNVKHERKMKLEDFIKNLRSIDDGCDIDRDYLVGIYERVRSQQFRSGIDHATQVLRVEQSVVGKKPQLCLPHRRLVCYCRLFEVNDPSKKEKLGLHQREVFLFNDSLLVTKIFSKKKGAITYSFKQSFMLCGMQVFLFETSHYQYGIRLTNHIDGKILITFNARNEHDRSKFVDDLKDCILEVNEMEAIRIEEELHKQKHTQKQLELNRISSDSGVVDVELLRPDGAPNRLSAPDCNLKKSNLSSSLVDLNNLSECTLKPQRRGSGGSLDSGMYMLHQSSTTSVSTTASQEENFTPASTPSSTQTSLLGKKKGSSKSLQSEGAIDV